MQEFLTPVLALIIWTFVMWVLLYKRRLPAMSAINKNPQEFINKPELWDQMPKSATNATDNYNHLHEQPVIFYALMFYLALSQQGDTFNMYLAWGYVVLRIIHSLIQVTYNKVIHRFLVFALSTVVLIVMSLRAVAGLF